MKFKRTINIWAEGTQEAICAGRLKVQRGQWMRCGTSGKRCRYVGHNGRTLNVVHWQGSSAATEARFRDRVESVHLGELYATDKQAWKAAMEARRNSA